MTQRLIGLSRSSLRVLHGGRLGRRIAMRRSQPPLVVATMPLGPRQTGIHLNMILQVGIPHTHLVGHSSEGGEARLTRLVLGILIQLGTCRVVIRKLNTLQMTRLALVVGVTTFRLRRLLLLLSRLRQLPQDVIRGLWAEQCLQRVKVRPTIGFDQILISARLRSGVRGTCLLWIFKG